MYRFTLMPLYLYASIMRSLHLYAFTLRSPFTCMLLQLCSLYLFTFTLRSPMYAFTIRPPLPVCFYIEVPFNICYFPEIPFTWMLLHWGSLYLYAFCGPLGENLSWQKLRQQSILYVDILHQLHPVLYQDVLLGLIHHQSPPLMVKQ